MAGFCIPKELVDGFLNRLRSGEIHPDKLAQMTSSERRTYFAEILGEENAKPVNALFESKLLLKNQQLGMINWAQQVTGIKENARRDILSKVNRLKEVLDPATEDAFLEDLVSKKLGFDVTLEESQKIAELAKTIEQKKIAMENGGDRLEYGSALAVFNEYVGQLKTSNKKIAWDTGGIITRLSGISKSILSSLDNSFFGRQGIKTLYTNPTIWTRNFLKSWGDITKELKGQDAILPIKADIYSRPNAVNGKYKAMELAVGLLKEEAYPSSLPSRIPLLGRLFKASESAYNGAALRLRADLADLFILRAERDGINIKDPAQAKPIGKIINSLTGRGSIGRLETIGNEINSTLFSIKFLKSNWDVLSAHSRDKTMTPYARKIAATNLLKIVGGMASTLAIANTLWPGSVDYDPRSANFGKIKIGDTRFDITGGMGALITLASRVIPTVHKGEFGWYSKSSITNKYTKLSSGKFGAKTPVDLMYDFGEGKLSPLLSSLVTILKQQDFKGEKPTVGSVASGLVTPLPISTTQELLSDPNAAPFLISSILSGLGISTNTYGKK